MKKLFFSMIVVLFTLMPVFTTETEASSFREVKQVQTQTLLYTAASPSAKTVSTLPKGTLVTQFSTVAGGWSYVQANQQKGYVATASLVTPKSTIKIASSKSGLVVKDTATMKTKTVATLKYNMIVEDFGSVGGGWSFVQYGNVTGYVNSNFIGAPKSTKKYTKANVTLRNIASPSGKSTGTLGMNIEVYEYSQIAGWSYVASGSLRGYVPTAQLATTKQTVAPQKLTTFTHLRPSKISWMKYDFHILDEPTGILSGYLESHVYENSYGYVPVNNWNEYQPLYLSFQPGRFAMGMPETDWTWAEIATPLVQNKPTPIYEYAYYEDEVDVHIGNAFLRTTTGTVTTPAGTFKNVVHVEQKYFRTPISTHFYFAPGYGLIKMVNSQNKILFELYEYF